MVYLVKRGVYTAYRTWLIGLMCVVGLHVAASAQPMVRAKLGIEVLSGKQTSLAKARDRLKKGDKLRVYVLPEQPGYIYLIYSDGKTAMLLSNEMATRLAMTALPSHQTFYEIDGESRIERLTVIYSPNAIEAIANAFRQPSIPHRQWLDLETQLMKASKIALGQTVPTSFGIAGNVRSEGALRLVDPGYQSHTVGERVSLTLTTELPSSSPVTFKAHQLPPGLSLNTTTGTISGIIAPEALNQSPYRVKISVTNALRNGNQTFTWAITRNPLLQQLRITSGKNWLLKRYQFTIQR